MQLPTSDITISQNILVVCLHTIDSAIDCTVSDDVTV